MKYACSIFSRRERVKTGSINIYHKPGSDIYLPGQCVTREKADEYVIKGSHLHIHQAIYRINVKVKHVAKS